MGKDHDPRLLAGWQVDEAAAEDWLLEHNVSCCTEDEACYCGLELCWKACPPPLPRGWTLVQVQLDGDGDRCIWLTLDFGRQVHWSAALPLEAFTKLLQASEFQDASQLAAKLKAKGAAQLAALVEVS